MSVPGADSSSPHHRDAIHICWQGPEVWPTQCCRFHPCPYPWPLHHKVKLVAGVCKQMGSIFIERLRHVKYVKFCDTCMFRTWRRNETISRLGFASELPPILRYTVYQIFNIYYLDRNIPLSRQAIYNLYLLYVSMLYLRNLNRHLVYCVYIYTHVQITIYVLYKHI